MSIEETCKFIEQYSPDTKATVGPITVNLKPKFIADLKSLARSYASLLGLAKEAVNFYAYGVGAMANTGDPANQERCIQEAIRLRKRFEAAIAEAEGRE